MSPIEKARKQQIIQDITRKAQELLDSTDLENISESDAEYITKQLLVDKLKDRLDKEVQKRKLDLDEHIGIWLKKYSSQKTRKVYRTGIEMFRDWLQKRDLHILEVGALEVEEYVQELQKKGQKGETMRVRIAAVSSFFTYLERVEVITRNYFKGCTRPDKKAEHISADEYPEDSDIETMETWLRKDMEPEQPRKTTKEQTARRLLAVVTIIKNHGLRVGALNSMVIDRKDNYTADSKGKQVSGKLSAESLEVLQEMGLDMKTPFKNMKTDTIAKAFQRFCERLYKHGALREIYSLHDIRHYAAVKFYTSTKDIVATQRFLGHTSLDVTQTYLVSLNLET